MTLEHDPFSSSIEKVKDKVIYISKQGQTTVQYHGE